MNYLINDFSSLPESNKPRERLVKFGPEALSDIELLAIILRTGTKNLSVVDIARSLIQTFESLEKFFNADIKRLEKVKGIGKTKAAVIKAVLEISKRIYIQNNNNQKNIKCPKDAFDFIKKELYGKNQEHLYLITLDSRRKIISKDLICIGSINETIVPQREILRTALAKDAVNIIIVHNHPSGDPTPSKEDLFITEKVKDACICIGINFLDHIITANNQFTSVKSITGFVKKAKGGEKSE